jgi:hypothetical protein
MAPKIQTFEFSIRFSEKPTTKPLALKIEFAFGLSSAPNQRIKY